MTAAVRAFGASGDAWFGGDVEDEAAELLGTVRGRGRYGGQAGGSGELGGARAAAGERAEGRQRAQRVRERRQGLRGIVVASPGGAGEAGGGRIRTCARHASPLPTGRRKKTALPSVGWAAIVPTQVGR